MPSRPPPGRTTGPWLPTSGSPWLYFALTIVSAALFGLGFDLEVDTLISPAFVAVVGFGSVAGIKALMLIGSPDRRTEDL